MIVDAIILVLAGALIVVGLWLIWRETVEAWAEWRNAR
jgi:uncharacterized membrane protein YozB (DUF420 family)